MRSRVVTLIMSGEARSRSTTTTRVWSRRKRRDPLSHSTIFLILSLVLSTSSTTSSTQRLPIRSSSRWYKQAIGRLAIGVMNIIFRSRGRGRRDHGVRRVRARAPDDRERCIWVGMGADKGLDMAWEDPLDNRVSLKRERQIACAMHDRSIDRGRDILRCFAAVLQTALQSS